MTNIEKWCNDNSVLYYPDIAPCEMIGMQGFCDICPYHFFDENECKDECNKWGVQNGD